MANTFPALDTRLDDGDFDAFYQYASASDPDQRYLTGFGSVDPYSSLYFNGKLALLVRSLDAELAKKESQADHIRTPVAYDRNELAKTYEGFELEARVIKRFCAEFDADSLLVPPQLPVGLADEVRTLDMSITVDDSATVPAIRTVKSQREIEAIQAAQTATEAAMERVESIFQSATIADNILTRDGNPITSEYVKTEIELTLIRHGCSLEETIVAGGDQGADPHDRGTGPLPANKPIVVDIFPRHKESKYFADMTRTFCVGNPSDEVTKRYNIIQQARDAAIAQLEPGVTGEAIHHVVCDIFEAEGYPTVRSDPGTSTGFTHSTGHGVGLEIHERPRISTGGGELKSGHVVTIEPGLYEPSIGGIRLEDLVVITDEGCMNLTAYPTELEV